MQYAYERGTAIRNTPGVAAVVALHVLVGWALVSGLARKVVEVIKAPMEARVIEEIRKPPPDLPPPPPPKLAVPPPPFIPPPEVNVQVPQASPPPVITSVTTALPPPGPPAVAAPPAQPAPPQPAVRRNFAASFRVEPAYPVRARARGIGGTVVAQAQVRPDGTVAEVRIVSAKPPHVFDSEVVRALMQWKFNPEPAGFVGEYEITFRLRD